MPGVVMQMSDVEGSWENFAEVASIFLRQRGWIDAAPEVGPHGEDDMRCMWVFADRPAKPVSTWEALAVEGWRAGNI